VFDCIGGIGCRRSDKNRIRITIMRQRGVCNIVDNDRRGDETREERSGRRQRGENGWSRGKMEVRFQTLDGRFKRRGTKSVAEPYRRPFEYPRRTLG